MESPFFHFQLLCWLGLWDRFSSKIFLLIAAHKKKGGENSALFCFLNHLDGD